MPTPARRATASRLASAPPALNTLFAASSTRSRLRSASARGLRRFFVDDEAIETFLTSVADLAFAILPAAIPSSERQIRCTGYLYLFVVLGSNIRKPTRPNG